MQFFVLSCRNSCTLLMYIFCFIVIIVYMCHLLSAISPKTVIMVFLIILDKIKAKGVTRHRCRNLQPNFATQLIQNCTVTLLMVFPSTPMSNNEWFPGIQIKILTRLIMMIVSSNFPGTRDLKRRLAKVDLFSDKWKNNIELKLN